MCSYTIRARASYAPLQVRARPRGPVSVKARPPYAPLQVVTALIQRRLLSEAGLYVITEDGRRIVVGVCNAG
jgi:hypothetical protein